MSTFSSKIVGLIEKGLVPDFLIRAAIRCLLKQRLLRESSKDVTQSQEKIQAFIDLITSSPIAVQTEKANEQHYEVGADFYKLVLGKNLKYSSCFWNMEVQSLDQAEENMLKLSAERAQIVDGMSILELGCGWGSFSLWLAKFYPNSKIIGVSNSHSQKKWIDRMSQERQLKNLEIITADMNSFDISQKFDRVVSIEMFEHMRNLERLLMNVSKWLVDEGKLFVHIFSHKSFAYLFQSEGMTNWMGRYFFSGGMMPSHNLLLYFQKHLSIEKHWAVNGTHYAKTAEAWHENMYRFRDKVMNSLSDIYGNDKSGLWFVRWKLFFLACAELFGYRAGNEWLVSHYLFSKKKISS